MHLAIYHPSNSAVCADALFLSALQRSDNLSTRQVRKAIAAAVRAHGGAGCAQQVAQEFGDHPEIAAARMQWARAVCSEVFASPSRPGQDGSRRRPGLPVAGLRRRRLVRT
jgi:hypothetical protein